MSIRVSMFLFGVLYIFDFIEGLSGLLEFLVHGEEFPHPRVHPRVLTNQKYYVFNLNNETIFDILASIM